MRRKTARPFGQSTSVMRLASMLMALVVLWALYGRLKDPSTWQFFADEKELSPPVQAAATTEPELEQIVPGPNDQDDEEVASIQNLFEFVTDRAPLQIREMDAYWRLMDWSRTQPFAELEQRAKDDVPFTQLWEEPAKYRGQLIRLRLHVRRVIQYDAPENPSNIAKVCEAWGWTDESRSFPYVVVFPEPPQGLPIGTDIRAEIVFVGYFLKVMTYTAFDRVRGTPLLVGRARLVPPTASAPARSTDLWVVLVVLVVTVTGILAIGWSVWMRKRSRRKSATKILPDDFSSLASPGGPMFDDTFGQSDADQILSATDFPVTFDAKPEDCPPAPPSSK